MSILRMAVMRPAVQLKRILSGTFGQTRYTRHLETHQYNPPEILKKMQAARLRSLLIHAVNNVPHYKHLKGELKLTIDTIFDDITNFPILTRDIISNEQNTLMAEGEKYISKKKSGGTTSKRINVYSDISSLTERPDEYFNRMNGIYPGMSRLILNRHERHYLDNNEPEIEVACNRISRTYLVNPTFFNEDKLKIAYDILINKKPKIICGNSTFVYEFAKAIEDMGWESRHVPIIEGCCVTMQPQYIETLQRVFGTRIYNTYGATEINTVACECEERNGMHYIPMCHYIEILNKKGKSVDEGESGELVVTSLSHNAMPIIRYKIGDFAAFSNEKCKCKRTYPLLKRIDGRVVETIRSSVGTHITIHEIVEILTQKSISQNFQAVQEDNSNIIFNFIDMVKVLDVSDERYIQSNINRILGQEMKIKFVYNKNVIKQSSGKTLRVLSTFNN